MRAITASALASAFGDLYERPPESEDPQRDPGVKEELPVRGLRGCCARAGAPVRQGVAGGLPDGSRPFGPGWPPPGHGRSEVALITPVRPLRTRAAESAEKADADELARLVQRSTVGQTEGQRPTRPEARPRAHG